MAPDSGWVTTAVGRIGVLDAGLIRWLRRHRALTDELRVCVTGSVLSPLVETDEIERAMASFEDVDAIIPASGDRELGSCLFDVHRRSHGERLVSVPERELLRYSMAAARGCLGRCDLVSDSSKLAGLDELIRMYGSRAGRRDALVGMVSGAFDVLHVGHVRLIELAASRVDVLVVLAMSTTSIKGQPKNFLGDRPAYDERDRADVLSALRRVDHVIFFDDPDCRVALRRFCPDCYIKTAEDATRRVVQAEAEVVSGLGGDTIFLDSGRSPCSSTAILEHLRMLWASTAPGTDASPVNGADHPLDQDGGFRT